MNLVIGHRGGHHRHRRRGRGRRGGRHRCRHRCRHRRRHRHRRRCRHRGRRRGRRRGRGGCRGHRRGGYDVINGNDYKNFYAPPQEVKQAEFCLFRYLSLCTLFSVGGFALFAHLEMPWVCYIIFGIQVFIIYFWIYLLSGIISKN